MKKTPEITDPESKRLFDEAYGKAERDLSVDGILTEAITARLTDGITNSMKAASYYLAAGYYLKNSGKDDQGAQVFHFALIS